MDGLPSDNGAFGFFKPLLGAAAGDISLDVRFPLNWLLRKQSVELAGAECLVHDKKTQT